MSTARTDTASFPATTVRRPTSPVAMSPRHHCVLWGLGAILVLNLNALAYRVYDNAQAFTPVILVLCLASCLTKTHLLTKTVPTIGKMLAAGFLFYGAIGYISGINGRVGFSAELLRRIFSSSLILVAVAHLSCLIGVSYRGRRQLVKLLKGLYVLCFLAAISVLIGFVLPNWQSMVGTRNLSRYTGVFHNPNQAGHQILMAVVCGAALTAFTKRRYWFLGIAAPGVVIMTLTGSRSGLLGLVIICTAASYYLFPRRDVSLVIVVLLIGVCAIAGLRAFVLYKTQTGRGSVAYRFSRMADLLSGEINDGSTGQRLGLAREAVGIWLDTSLLTGAGLGALDNMPKAQTGPHNSFLRILGESGLVGGVPFFFCWGIFFLQARKSPSTWLRTLLIGMFLALSISACSSHTVFLNRNNLFVLGLCLGLMQAETVHIARLRKMPSPSRKRQRREVDGNNGT